MKKSIRGFTIIELIMIASILSVLATFLIIKYPSVLRNSRNLKRANDLKSYQNALELNANKNIGLYPISSSSTDLTTLCAQLGMVGTHCVSDPKGGTYNYQTDAIGKRYVVWAAREGTSSYIAYCSNGSSGDSPAEPSGGDCPDFSIAGNYGVVLNEHDGTCNHVCASNGFSSCQNIGMDVDASDGKFYIIGCWISWGGGCNSNMWNLSFLTCQGNEAMWTFCNCKK